MQFRVRGREPIYINLYAEKILERDQNTDLTETQAAWRRFATSVRAHVNGWSGFSRAKIDALSARRRSQ